MKENDITIPTCQMIQISICQHNNPILLHDNCCANAGNPRQSSGHHNNSLQYDEQIPTPQCAHAIPVLEHDSYRCSTQH